METILTVEEAYKAMYIYLNNLYEMTNSDDLAGFLGSMTLLEDGKPIDSAIWDDWLMAINDVVTTKCPNRIPPKKMSDF